MHIDNTIERGPRLRNPSRRRSEHRLVFLEKRNHLGVGAGGGQLPESLASDEGLVCHAGLLCALVQLAHEALVGRQLGFCERLADVGDGGLHQGEDRGLVRGDDVDGLRSKVDILIVVVCREVVECFAGV
jgi:hypothetical protein